MLVKKITFAVPVMLVALGVPLAHGQKIHQPKDANIATGPAVMWRDPTDLESRDLFYGPGGRENEPHGPFTFLKEDMDGTNPKFVVRDKDGVKWKVKLGIEARPETVATRLVWATGYFASEDYFLADFKADGMPAKLHRGQKLVGADGSMHNVRLKREDKEDGKKLGTWNWRHDAFTGTRELNGLRVLMAVMNSWDVKDVNNAIYQVGPERIYMVSDLGAAFGAPGRTWPQARSKDNLDAYTNSAFIRSVTADTVDFATPARPRYVYMVGMKEYLSRIHLEWIGKNIPRTDAKWMGALLARISPQQMRDAFRAGGYSQEEIDGYVKVLQSRVGKLTDL
jgi:hypothetical protein